MNPHDTWCPNSACPAPGQADKGTIGIHSRKDQRYICRQCGKTFGARIGTLFHRRRIPAPIITQVVTLLSYGCPVVAIEAAFALHAATIRAWGEAAGAHAEAVHHAQVVTPRDLGHVQADELRIKTQCGVVWMAMAMMVTTRLWLGGVISTRRNQDRITRLVAIIAASAQCAPLLLLVDGLASYIPAFRAAFRTRQSSGGVGAPRKVPWPDLVIGQVIKRTHGRRLVAITRRVVQGATATLVRVLWQEPGCLVLNTASIERLNGTFRARLAPLARRTHHLVHRKEVLHASMYLVGAVYNFCTHHASLTTKEGGQRTPAMAAGITTHRWTISELVHHRVPPPRWHPPTRRGRRSTALQGLIDRWCS